jgi:Transposase Tn5 dimerisation domain
MIALFLIISWRVLYLIKIGRANPDLPCTDIFENAEWMSVHRILFRDQAIPEKAPTLGIFIKMIAKLGGHIGRNNDDPPGPKVMWKGLARMSDFTLAWESFGPSELEEGGNPLQKKQRASNESPQKGKKNMLKTNCK